MRYVNTVAAAALSILASSLLFGQSGQGLFITNYKVVSQRSASGSQSYVTFSADLVNQGSSRGSVTATVSSLDPFSIRVVPGQDTLHFPNVPAKSTTPSSDTFTLLLDTSVPFDPSKLQWSFQSTEQGPYANPGPDQTAQVGVPVTLDGSGSTDPNGGTVRYSWTFASRPQGSAAILSNVSNPVASFVPDVPGTYVVTLTVSSRFGSASANVTINTAGNAPPVANAGPDQNAAVGSTVTLNGSKSTTNGGPLAYFWTLTSVPAGSTAVLSGANTISPTFVVDKPGDYIAQLIVKDGPVSSQPSTVKISTTTVAKPIADPGLAQVVNVGGVVQLNGSGSTDAGGRPLTYKWALISAPQGSAAALNSTTVVNPTFTADRPGTYIAQLIVNNGVLDSDPKTVMITTNPVLKPVANPGPNQTVPQNSTVQLTGSGTDPQNLPLTYKWTLVTKPSGSSASLSSAVIPNPTFVADLIGNYVAQLVVNNGYLDSDPKTVTISTTCAQPVANAGPNQDVPVGLSVTLDGSASGDSCRDPLTYSWTFTTRPAGSKATLSGADTVKPTFTADVAGTYVVQLIVNNGLNSNPSTVQITAGGNAILLTPNPLNIGSGAATMNVILANNVTTPGGQVINLTSSDPTVATVPATVTIPQGSSAANFTVTPGTTAGTATIRASAPGLTSGSATVFSTAPSITVSVDPGPIGITHVANGAITLSSPAPAGGLTVTLTTSPNGIVTLQPTSVVIPGGAISGVFVVTGVAQGSATITASAPTYASGSTNVTAALLGAILLPAGVSVGVGQSVPYNVTLVTGAPAGGVTVTLTSADPTKAAIAPSSVFIPARATTPITQPVLTGVGVGSTSITASAPGFTGDTQSVTVTIGLTFTPSNVTFTGTKVLTLNLSGPAPAGGLTVNLSSDNPSVATVPSTATFAPNATSTSVLVTGISQGSTTIRASAPNIAETTAAVTVAVLGTISISANPVVAPGQSTPLQVVLSQAAPAGGVFITLASSDPSKLTVVPANILIAQGSTTPNAPPQLNGIAPGSVNVTATASGFSQASIPVKVGASVAIAPSSATITGLGNSTNLTLTLSVPAPAGGLTVNLTSDNPSVATVPATATFLANTNTATVTVTSVGQGSTIIRASSLNVPEATAAINVVTNAPGNVLVPATLSLPLGPPAPYPVTLSQPAPGGGVTITLVSSDPSKVTITSSVFVAAGSTVPATQAQVRGVAFGSSTITASAPGFTTGTGVVLVNSAAVTFSPSSLTVTAPASQSLTLTLSAPAPANGLTINLSSSDPTVASVPSTVTFSPGSTTVSVPVTGMNPGSATIHASALPNIPDATAAITVVNASGILLPANVVVGPGQTVDFPVTLAAAAPAGGAFVSLSSTDTSKLTITPSSIFIPAGATTSASAPRVTGVNFGSASIVAMATGLGSASQQVLVSGSGAFSPSTLNITGTTTQVLTLNLSSPAPPNGLTINLSSSNPAVATVPATVNVAPNASSVGVPVTGVSSGTAIIHASSLPIIADTTATVTVGTSPAVVLPPFLIVGQLLSAPLPVSLSVPAPPGGVTVTISSSDPSKAYVTPVSVFIPGGATVPTTRPTLNATNDLGYATLTASAPGYAATSLEIHITDNLRIGLPDGVTVGLGQSVPVPVALPGAAPAGGITINLVSSDPSKLTVTPSVFVPAGESLPTTMPVVTGVGLGTVILSADNPAYTSVVKPINVVASVSFSSPAITIGTGVQNIVLALSGPAPAAGLTINLFSNNPGVATVPSSVTFPAGATTVNVPVTGLAAGSAVISTSSNSPNVGSTATTITVNPGANPSPITVSGATVGQNLESQVTVGLPQPAAGAGQQVTLTSADASKVVVAAQATDTGSASVVLTVPAGQTSVTAYAQGLAASGSVNLTATAAGMNSGSGVVTLAPSAIVLAGPGGIGTPGFTSNQGQSTTLTVSSARLDGGLNFAAVQPVRGGFTANVNVTSSTTAVGTIATSPVTIAGGSSSAATQFNAVGSGSATITAAEPPGFSQPAQGANSVTATVNPPTPLSPANVTVGRHLEAPAIVTLNSQAPAAGVSITLTSNDPSKVLLSTTPGGSGVTSIQLVAPPGATQTPNFYVYGLANSGSATYSASAPGFGSATGIVTLAPSGVVVSGPGGIGVSSFVTTPGAANTNITVTSALLDASLNFVAPQAVAGGSTVNANVSSSNTNIGTITGSPVTIPGGSSSATTQFQPANGGSTSISVNTPSGYDTPAGKFTSVTATVGAPAISITDGVTIGQNLQVKGTVSLGQVAPAGGYQVTLKANNVIDPNLPNGGPRRLLISATPTDAGADSITITIPAGATSANYWLQAMDGVGSITYVASSPGFNNVTATVNLAPSGLVISGPLGLGLPFPVSVSLSAGGTTPLTVYTARLDQFNNSLVEVQQLAGGLSVTTTLGNSNSAVGTVTTPVTINGGSDRTTAQFTPQSQGSTTITVFRPVIFQNPSDNRTVTINVTQ